MVGLSGLFVALVDPLLPASPPARSCASSERSSGSATGCRSWRARAPLPPPRLRHETPAAPASAPLLPLGLRLPRLLLGDLAAHRVHVDGPYLTDEVLECRGGQRTGL